MQKQTAVWVFTSTEEASKFVKRRIDQNRAYLDLVEDRPPIGSKD